MYNMDLDKKEQVATDEEKERDKFVENCCQLAEFLTEALNNRYSPREIVAVFSNLLAGVLLQEDDPEGCYSQFKNVMNRKMNIIPTTLIGEYYEKNPPDIVLDDLGIYHECEVPLPAKYKRDPCKCGIVHKWESPETFFIEESSDLHGKRIKRCCKCGDVLALKLVAKYGL